MESILADVGCLIFKIRLPTLAFIVVVLLLFYFFDSLYEGV